jgi:tRNA pseudouridine55 synthase
VLPGARVGHAGTLDPAATGVLVICVGAATKISSFLMEAEKEYVGTARLGVTTDTQDADGRIVRERPVGADAARIREAAARFVGEIEQVPPMYSAVKVGGEKLYRLARQGREIERASRRVRVHAFEIVGVALPDVDFVLSCSKGTYVRTILHDLGEVLGCGAHLARLVRERQGCFRRAAAVTWEQLLGDRGAEIVRAAGMSQEDALAFLPAIEVPGTVSGPPAVGVRWDAAAAPEGPSTVRLLRGGRTVALGRAEAGSVRVVHVLPGPDRFGRRPRR